MGLSVELNIQRVPKWVITPKTQLMRQALCQKVGQSICINHISQEKKRGLFNDGTGTTQGSSVSDPVLPGL